MGLSNTISRLPALLALLLLPAIGLSQLSGVSEAEKHTVSGQVVNSVTGQPIAGALVQFGDHAGLTDREGQFEFPGVTAAFGGDLASKPGYFPEQYDTSLDNLDRNQPIVLKLIPEAIIFGKVLDQNGQPLEGLRVQLKMLQVRNGLRHWEPRDSTMTNVEGEFRFFELQAGKYSISTGFQVDGSPDSASAMAFAPAIYPTRNGEQESALSVTAGDQIEADLNPPSQKLYAVSGHIEGQGVTGVNIEAEPAGGGTINPAVRFNRFTGDFRLMLPSGSYSLKVHAFVQRDQFFATREISVGDAPLKNISISLAPLATVPVEIEYQTSNTSTQETPPQQPLFANVSLEEADPSGQGRSYGAQPSQLGSSADDSLLIRDLQPGQYMLQARPQPPWYLASATCGGLDLKREPMRIAGSAAGCSIHAVMRNDAATLDWSVNASNQVSPGKQIFAYALPLDNSVQSMSAGVTQAQGANAVAGGSFEGLAPGRYLVIALDHAEELPYREPDVSQRYLSLGKEVALTANSKSDVRLNVVTGEP